MDLKDLCRDKDSAMLLITKQVDFHCLKVKVITTYKQ